MHSYLNLKVPKQIFVKQTNLAFIMQVYINHISSSGNYKTHKLDEKLQIRTNLYFVYYNNNNLKGYNYIKI